MNLVAPALDVVRGGEAGALAIRAGEARRRDALASRLPRVAVEQVAAGGCAAAGCGVVGDVLTKVPG